MLTAEYKYLVYGCTTLPIVPRLLIDFRVECNFDKISLVDYEIVF